MNHANGNVHGLPAGPEYIHEEESQTAQYVVPLTSEENDVVDNYTYSEPPQEVVSHSDNWGDEPLPEEPVSSFSNGMAMAPEEPVQPPPVHAPHVEEPVGEPVKKTYASIVCVTFLILLCIVCGPLADMSIKQRL
jgi:hypothetical protein